MIDIIAPEVVEIQYDLKRGIVWINVDGICEFRACRIKVLEVIKLPLRSNKTTQPDNSEKEGNK